MSGGGGFLEAFQLFDQDNDGVVSGKEMQRMLASMGNPLSDQEVKDIMKESGSTDSISYAAFTKLLGIGIKQSRETDPEEEMQDAFRLFDRDGDGTIGPKDMKDALKMFGVTLTDREVDQLIGEATLSSSRTVSYDVFKRVMAANRGS